MDIIVENPNFSIVAPTGCNAHCDFCFWDRKYTEQDIEKYLTNLAEVLAHLPDTFNQCSITGGEPTMLPWLRSVMRLVRERFDKVVFTTNGYALGDHLYLAREGLINHLNISRHKIGFDANCEVFKTNDIPEDGVVKALSSLFQHYGIDVSLNCVVPTNFQDLNFVNDYIEHAKQLNCNAVAFRKDHSDLMDMGIEPYLPHIIGSSGCPACKVDVRLMNGMLTYWKYSVSEPSNDLGGIYELIYHPNGRITADWAGKQVIDINTLYTAEGE